MPHDKPHAEESAIQASLHPTQARPALTRPQRQERRRWWIKLVVQPIVFLGAGIALIVAVGVVQHFGWLTEADDSHISSSDRNTADKNVRYICPMMCTPPLAEPGRCPVCNMELVLAAAGGAGGDGRSIQVDPVARRLANIRTVAVKSVPLVRQIRAIGQLQYDEGTLKTIAARVDGRLDRLYADYTGVVVQAGDELALLYSPLLYSSQVELLVARRARDQRESTRLSPAATGQGLYENARERLIEFGMLDSQIAQLEEAGQANSRLALRAPISGTVIEKNAVEGQYIKTGEPIYRLADLSTVWLMLQLFPEDVAAIRYGQQVEAEIQSLPGHTFSGRVAFVDPLVDPATRTVGVRVVIRNENGLLRIGDYATATIAVPISGSGEPLANTYDPDLADKWISPRHPHVIESEPGACRICGAELVPAADFGFTSDPTQKTKTLVLPRDAVLVAGQSSVVYVETEPGRFELRRVLLGPRSGDEIAIVDGVQEGEKVARDGNFLIDSQMQLAGNPSLIDPTKRTAQAVPKTGSQEKLAASLSSLSAEDRILVERQRICPVTEMPLGSMGTPIKVDVQGDSVFICCEGCRESLLKEPLRYLANLTRASSVSGTRDDVPQSPIPPIGTPQLMETAEAVPTQIVSPESDKQQQVISEALSRLSPADRSLAELQRICPVTKMPLGSMGTPIKVDVRGAAIFICCEGCRDSLLADPAKYLEDLPREESP